MSIKWENKKERMKKKEYIQGSPALPAVKSIIREAKRECWVYTLL